MEPINEINQIILAELRSLRGEVNDLRGDVARLKVQDEENNKNEHKFWADNWAPVKSDIADIKNRIAIIEATNLKLLEKRLDSLESKTEEMREAENARLREEANARKISVALGAAAGGLIAALSKFIDI